MKKDVDATCLFYGNEALSHGRIRASVAVARRKMAAPVQWRNFRRRFPAKDSGEVVGEVGGEKCGEVLAKFF